MSNNSMDTEPGGESGQYEGNLGYTDPVAKQAGQLGDSTTSTQMADEIPKSAPTGPNSQGVTPAEKMRYGQTIQESGGGGGKTSAEGHADNGATFGAEGADAEGDADAAKQRRTQGYGGERDMDTGIGG